jgi:pimeloyl-ACP methyl ester carboxylesterase
MMFEFLGQKIHYQKEGSGAPLVLLHGFLESLDMWDAFTQKWMQNYTVIRIDLPGHGKSERLPGTTVEQIAEVCEALLNHEGIPTASFVGHSLGGYVSLAFAERYPERMERLVLFHSSTYADNHEGRLNRDRAIEILQNHPKLYIRQTLQGLFRPDTVQHFQVQLIGLIEQAQQVDPKGYMDAVLAMKERPDRSHILASGLPVLFLAGTYDPVIPMDISREQFELIQTGSGQTLLESGHMGFIEQPYTSWQIITEFLQFQK